MLLFSTSFVISVLFGEVKMEKIGSFCVKRRKICFYFIKCWKVCCCASGLLTAEHLVDFVQQLLAPYTHIRSPNELAMFLAHSDVSCVFIYLDPRKPLNIVHFHNTPLKIPKNGKRKAPTKPLFNNYWPRNLACKFTPRITESSCDV